MKTMPMKTMACHCVTPINSVRPAPRPRRSPSILRLIKGAIDTREYRKADGARPLDCSGDEALTSIYHRAVSSVRELITGLQGEGKSPDAIADELNEAGISPRRGAAWQPMDIVEALRN